MCKFNVNQEQLKKFNDFKKDFVSYVERHINKIKKTKSQHDISYLDSKVERVFKIIDDFCPDIDVCTSEILVIDMQTVLLNKLSSDEQ